MGFLCIVASHPMVLFFSCTSGNWQIKSQRENDQKSNEFPINLSQDASWKVSPHGLNLLVTGIRGGGREPNLFKVFKDLPVLCEVIQPLIFRGHVSFSEGGDVENPYVDKLGARSGGGSSKYSSRRLTCFIWCLASLLKLTKLFSMFNDVKPPSSYQT